jgi:hypothetical protein
MSELPETRSVCPACGHIDGAHLDHCRIQSLESQLQAADELAKVLRDSWDNGTNYQKVKDAMLAYEKARG